ncbi:hypothetical protein JR316_0009908 [Psilocybe cubensis]|uniref:Uncharacterized protein n=2 Tax=Psilocybe cubensis TaxID=181762 RepID=A0ACB8GQH8_PSICU|nr:hypothetical protein JR316_0009908 [Psilocybe cubensis]KAH9477682.1 hypothetical protein JR316_0009908 [Psilocybe cubensis]
MIMIDKHLAAVLQLPEDCEEEEASSALVALITSAVHDKDPRSTLSDLHKIISSTDAPKYLDPLNTLPHLLSSKDVAAKDIISVIGHYCSAKEVVMAVQEALERLEYSLDVESEHEEGHDITQRQGDSKYDLTLNQFIILIDTYTSAIPRLTLRRKSAADTLRPMCKELGSLIGSVTSKATRVQGLSVLSSIFSLVKEIGRWSDTLGQEKLDDLNACKTIVNNLLDRSLLACERFIKANIAQRTLEECHPRLSKLSRTNVDWQEGAQIMSKFLETYNSLGISSTTSQCTTSHLVASAYQPPDIAAERLLSLLLPVLITSLQTNTFLDESLAVLVKALHEQPRGRDLPHDITMPLFGLLPSLASAHPDPAVRHQAFRVLSLLLSLSDPQLKFQHLVELTRDSEFPQMRVASVGLVKESLLQALSFPGHGQNPFLSPLFLRTFGPIIFRPDPPDLFASKLTLKGFRDTHEPARLVECLSLFYVLLLRDDKNLTGIRDKDIIKSIDHNLLAPLRRNLTQWMDDPSISKDLHDITGVVPLQISLERIDTALVSRSWPCTLS